MRDVWVRRTGDPWGCASAPRVHFDADAPQVPRFRFCRCFLGLAPGQGTPDGRGRRSMDSAGRGGCEEQGTVVPMIGIGDQWIQKVLSSMEGDGGVSQMLE